MNVQLHIVDRERIVIPTSDEPSHLVLLRLRQLFEQFIDVIVGIPFSQYRLRELAIAILHIALVVRANGGTQRASSGEQLRVMQGEDKSTTSTGGGSGNRPAGPLRATTVVFLDVRNQLLDKEILEEETILRVVEIADAFLAIGIRRNYDHGSDLAPLDRRIHKLFQLPIMNPSLLIGHRPPWACGVQQIKYWIATLGTVVTGRKIDGKFTLSFQTLAPQRLGVKHCAFRLGTQPHDTHRDTQQQK